MEKNTQVSTASGLNVVAGIWLILAPFALSYMSQTPKANDIWLGIIVGVPALIRAFSRQALWASWINIVAGVWLIIAPFLLGYSYTTPKMNDIILGIIVIAFAIWSSGASLTSSRRSQHRQAAYNI